jgi:hypothetical protein
VRVLIRDRSSDGAERVIELDTQGRDWPAPDLVAQARDAWLSMGWPIERVKIENPPEPTWLVTEQDAVRARQSADAWQERALAGGKDTEGRKWLDEAHSLRPLPADATMPLPAVTGQPAPGQFRAFGG